METSERCKEESAVLANCAIIRPCRCPENCPWIIICANAKAGDERMKSVTPELCGIRLSSLTRADLAVTVWSFLSSGATSTGDTRDHDPQMAGPPPNNTRKKKAPGMGKIARMYGVSVKSMRMVKGIRDLAAEDPEIFEMLKRARAVGAPIERLYKAIFQ